MFRNKLIGLSFIILLLLIVPTCFAEDNDAVMQNDNSNIDLISYSDSTPLGVDYYFNGSSEVDGDGSIDNPYNKLNSERLKSGSTIHLANGEYNLTSSKSISNIEIIGQEAEKTIIRYTGSAYSGRLSLSTNTYLNLKNVTLIGFNIDLEGAMLQADNTIIKNAKAFPTYSSATDLVNSASNSFGGAIYAYSYQTYNEIYLPTVILNNCTFRCHSR